MATAKLTDTKLKSLKARSKQYKVMDGTVPRLYVHVTPKGNGIFRLNFRFEGKEKTLTIGPYPELSLFEAREKAMEARKQIFNGIIQPKKKSVLKRNCEVKN